MRTDSVLASIFVLLSLCETGCTLGQGSGEVTSDLLRVDQCWDGTYDMRPDFFAGAPYRKSFHIRIQRGADHEEASDGIAILVDDVDYVRANLGLPLEVGLAAGVTPTGVPLEPDPDPPRVHIASYFHNTCRDQESTLHAVRGTITFEHMFNGDPNETKAAQRQSSAVFDVVVADPRKQPPGGGTIDAHSLSRLTGWFQFYFERGQPAQPFP